MGSAFIGALHIKWIYFNKQQTKGLTLLFIEAVLWKELPDDKDDKATKGDQ